jgi:RNA polymerase sigma-70 factor (ECF subfamily)
MADTTTIETMTAEILGFETLVASYQGMVFGIAYHFLHDRSIAEEVAQDVFLQLYRKLSSIQSEAHAIAWLRKVTSHRCIDYSRRRRKDLSLDDIPEPLSETSTADTIMDQRLNRLVASLPPKARIVVILRYQEELEPNEIARVLGWRLNTVKSQLQRSLAMLREKLERI